MEAGGEGGGPEAEVNQKPKEPPLIVTAITVRSEAKGKEMTDEIKSIEKVEAVNQGRFEDCKDRDQGFNAALQFKEFEAEETVITNSTTNYLPGNEETHVGLE